MTDQPATHWRQTLRASLLSARKDRDPARIAALRSALAAIDNAEPPRGVLIDAPMSGTIAGSVKGLGAAEVARRELSDGEIRALLQAEIDERLGAAEKVTAGGYTERATTLRTEAAVLADLLRVRLGP
jgi:uncharacterized protein YqeY